MADLAPGQTLDQYELQSVIARGGMATLFQARDLENGKTVALKVPLLAYESDIIFHQRFEREEQIGQRLHHPAIIKVYTPRQKSRMYLAMEYVEGEMLSERVRREGRLPVDTAVRLAIQIADALVYLHENNVVHRDLKPDNVMLLPDGGVKLMDFGIALDTSARKMTWSGLSGTMGTPDYMAPEQIKGLRGDERTDIYSLGVILYEMLTGEVPSATDNVYSSIRSKLREDPTPPRRVRPEISPALEEIILHALEREPRDRFETALEFRETLAHPESVVITNRAARLRPKPRLPRWLQLLMTVAAGAVIYGALFWGITRMALLTAHGHQP